MTKSFSPAAQAVIEPPTPPTLPANYIDPEHQGEDLDSPHHLYVIPPGLIDPPINENVK